MARPLHRLMGSLYDTPHLISKDSFDGIMTYLESRGGMKIVESSLEADSDNQPHLAVLSGQERRSRELLYNPETQIGFINIDGPTTYIEYQGMCGPSGPSYQAIRQQFDAMASAGARVIVLDQDSPGGEAYQAFETASYIRSVADEKGIKLISYVDGISMSASYVFSAACHEVIANPQASVGSIGVLVQLRNSSEKQKKEGVKSVYVTAGEGKVPLDAEGNFTEGFLEELQVKVDTLYGYFLDHVTTYRDVPVETLRGLGAKSFMADKALDLGLVDSLMSLNEFEDYLAQILEGREASMDKSIFKLGKRNGEKLEMGKEDMQLSVQLAEATEQLTELTTKYSDVVLVVEQLKSDLTAKDTLLSEVQEKLTQLASEKETMKLDSRKSALAAVLAEDKVEGMLTSLNVLDDTAFNSVLEGFKEQKEKLEKSDLFVELGSQGEEIEQDEVEAEDLTDKFIKEYVSRGEK